MSMCRSSVGVQRHAVRSVNVRIQHVAAHGSQRTLTNLTRSSDALSQTFTSFIRRALPSLLCSARSGGSRARHPHSSTASTWNTSRSLSTSSTHHASVEKLSFFTCLETAAEKYGDKPAVISNPESADQTWVSYPTLLQRSKHLANELLGSNTDLEQARVACLCAPGQDFVVTMLAVWRAGGVFVPLCTSHPKTELDYVLNDSGASMLVTSPEYEQIGTELTDTFADLVGVSITDNYWTMIDQHDTPASASTPTSSSSSSSSSSSVDGHVCPTRNALMIYTSGTTGKPKGVVSTHSAVEAQVNALLGPWEWSSSDRLLHCLPLHHVHGLIVCTVTPLVAGATIDFLPKFSPRAVWNKITDPANPMTVFMAVPTIYSRLISFYEQDPSVTDDMRAQMTTSASHLRLMVSGSAALPIPVMEKFKEISTHALLERYGMTETGICISNPMHGERLAGHVGAPLPGVETKIDEEGQLLVRGKTLFKEYWNKPEQTAKEFTQDGWFQTGDAVELNETSDGAKSFKITGRMSVDILKSGGYKISALDVEQTLLSHPVIKEIAVVGVPDDEYGQRLAAIIGLNTEVAESKNFDLKTLRLWAKERMAGYKVPTLLTIVDALPRNAMGKVNKKDLLKQHFPE